MTWCIVEPLLPIHSFAASSMEDLDARAGNNMDVLPDLIPSPWPYPARARRDVFPSINGLAFLPGDGDTVMNVNGLPLRW